MSAAARRASRPGAAGGLPGAARPHGSGWGAAGGSVGRAERRHSAGRSASSPATRAGAGGRRGLMAPVGPRVLACRGAPARGGPRAPVRRGAPWSPRRHPGAQRGWWGGRGVGPRGTGSRDAAVPRSPHGAARSVCGGDRLPAAVLESLLFASFLPDSPPTALSSGHISRFIRDSTGLSSTYFPAPHCPRCNSTPGSNRGAFLRGCARCQRRCARRRAGRREGAEDGLTGLNSPSLPC